MDLQTAGIPAIQNFIYGTNVIIFLELYKSMKIDKLIANLKNIAYIIIVLEAFVEKICNQSHYSPCFEIYSLNLKAFCLLYLIFF